MKNSLDGVYQEWLGEDSGIHTLLENSLSKTAQKEIESLQHNANAQEPILPNSIPTPSGMIQTL